MSKPKITWTAPVAVALVALLAGCVGVPTSSGVVAGEVLTDGGSEQFVLLPSDPVPGSDQQQILLDFIRAANSSQGNYEVARKFLTPDFADLNDGDGWDPTVGVSIRTGAPQVEVVSETELRYTLTVAAEVDTGGRYRDVPPASQSNLYSFEQVDGEWRISSAPSGIILSTNSFGAAFDEHPLYFFDTAYQYLVPDVRWFPRRATVSTRIVSELLAGPSSWLQRAVVSAFPAAIELGAGQVAIEDSVATVDLSDAARQANAVDRNRMRQQLDATLASLATTTTMTVDGVPLTVEEMSDQATQTPLVESAPLIGIENGFGFAGGDGVIGLPGLTPTIADLAPTAATLGSDQTAAAVRGGDGNVYLARSGADPVLLASGPDLVAPSIDPHGFVWSAPRANAAALSVFRPDGEATEFDTSTLPTGSRMISFDISRDGTRIALYLERESGPQLIVAGIIRDQDNVPLSLGTEPYEFALADGVPVDSAWVDNRTIATISVVGGEETITAFPLGGPRETLGVLPGANTITVLNNGVPGIRVLADGFVWRRGSSNWVATSTEATMLGTQQ